jgi:hypothetical protein
MKIKSGRFISTTMFSSKHWRSSVLVCGFIVLFMALAGTVGSLQCEALAATSQGAGPINPKRFEGRWVRSDGGYFLELRDVGNDGTVKAAYFNPRPVKIGKAELRNKEGTIALVVELHDVNYPGSTYTLRYDPSGDRLKGSYYQAVEKQTYEVEFVRYRER